MKTKLKHISKRSLALLLGILMMFSTLLVGTISTATAATGWYLNGDAFTWNGSSSGYEFLQSDVSNIIYYTFTASADGNKQLRIVNGSTNYGSSSSNDSDRTINTDGTEFTMTKSENPLFVNGSTGFTNGTTYTIELNISNTTNPVIKIYTGEFTGSSSSGNTTYYLMKNDHSSADKGSSVADFVSNNDGTYTATYNITTTGSHYFYVSTDTSSSSHSSCDYLCAGATFGSSDVQLYKYGTSNYSDSVTLNATVTGNYTFTFKVSGSDYYINCTAPTESTTESTTEPVSDTTYYIVGDQISNWGEFKSMTASEDGTYSYYENTYDSLEFKITPETNWTTEYNYNNVNNGFNCADVVLEEIATSGSDKANIKCTANPCYIIVYYPNTSLNTTGEPIICAATTLPQGQQYSITSSCDEHSRTDAPVSAAEGEVVEFSLKFDSGYELNSLSIPGVSFTQDATTGFYSFTMPANDVTINVTSKATSASTANKYYIRGSAVTGVSSWNASAAMTPSADGCYEYYKITDGTYAEFLIDKDDTCGSGGYYDQKYRQSKFNGTDLDVGVNGNNITVAAQSSAYSAYYVIIYYPNTDVNTTDSPIICASTALPDGLQQIVDVYAKDGTIIGGTAGKFAAIADTTITATDYVTNVADGTELQTAKAKVGEEITITTTIDASNRTTYLVKGWVVNGESVGIQRGNTPNTDGVYTTTFTIDPSWIDENNILEITPVYYYATDETNEDAFFVFYVEDFDEEIQEKWGNTISCYPYYYNGGENNATDLPFGNYPGQPMLKGEGDRYFIQLPKWSKDNAPSYTSTDANLISGIVINNYAYNSKHGELFSLQSYQTYDYNDFKAIVRSNPDVSNIIFEFKYNGEYDNSPSTSGYSSEEAIIAAGTHNSVSMWQDLTNYNNDSLSNIFGEDISNSTTKYLRVISNGYDSRSSYIGEYPTCWYVYAPADDGSGKWNLIAALPPSILYYKDADTAATYLEAEGLDSATVSEIKGYYTTLTSYSDYAVQIAYEGNAQKNNSGEYRCDGNWYYTIEGQEVVGDIKIQYEDSDISNRGAYYDDTFTSSGVGKVTGADVHFTNEDAEAHQYVTTLDNDQYYTMTAQQTSNCYKFIGWYLYYEDTDSYELLSRDIDASAVRNKSFTFVARYAYVDEVAVINIIYNFYDFQGASGEIAYTKNHDKSLDTPNSYSKTESIIEAYVNDDAVIAEIVKDNAPVIHSDYYDYALDESSIKYSYNSTDKTVYVTASMDDTPHIYSVTVNGEKYTGYYQNTLELFADDFGLEYDDDATALWYLVDGDNKTLYYDDFDLNYRFIVDNAQLEVVANDNAASLDGKSVIYNSSYELGYKDSQQKITQNFYITDYLDNAYDDNGSIIEGASNITYVGGGILYYSSDANGAAANDTVANALNDKETVINSVLNNNYTSAVNGTKDKIGYVYTNYDPSKIRYSEFLIAYQHIIGISLNNTDANADKYISAYSFFVYTYQLNGETYTQIQISDTMAVATAYEAE